MFTDIPTVKEWQLYHEMLERRFSANANILLVLKGINNRLLWYKNGPSKYAVLLRLKDYAQQVFDQLDVVAKRTITGQATKALLAVVQNKLDELEKFATAKYQRVACIGYEIEVPAGYNGDANDMTNIKARWNEMKEAITKAHTQYKQLLGKQIGNWGKLWPDDTDAKTLKIFMAPEFYFRGARGAYELDCLFYLIEEVRKVTGSADFKDWLFVMGTCVCATQQTKITGEVKKNTTDPAPADWRQRKEGTLLEMYAIVQKGGHKNSDGIHDLQVLKEYPSHEDFQRTSTPVDDDWYRPGRKVDLDTGKVKYSKKGRLLRTGASGSGPTARKALSQPGSREFVGDINDETTKPPVSEKGTLGCIFAMDGITFGLEVCRDHLMGRLRDAKDRNGVQIQLITSWGAYIDPVYRLTNAVAFNVDGSRGDSAVSPSLLLGVGGPGTTVTKRYPFPVGDAADFPGTANYNLHFYPPITIPTV
jgi:hypothetical protein